MATTGNRNSRRKPAMPAPIVPAMTAAEAAPAMARAHDAADIAAAPLLDPAALMPADIAPMPIPATASPEPDADPAPVATAAPAATEDSIMDTTTIETAADTVQDKAKTMFADATERTKGAVEKGQHLLAEMTEFNKGNIEALVESSKIAARGLETMGQDAAAYAKASFEGVSQAMRTLATVKSPTEFMRLQADYARTAFDAMVAQGSRSTEASLKLAGEVAQPISNRVALAADKMKIAA